MNDASLIRSDEGARSMRQLQVVDALARVVPKHLILSRTEETTPYECDGLTAYRESPLIVV